VVISPVSGSALDTIITHVLVHEIGHHFGLSDEDMRVIEGPE
jgi:predicted Zn-dependent protease with MMP-like domain